MNQESLLRITEGFHRTSTITNLEDRSVTFAKDQEWFDKLLKKDKHVCVIIKRNSLVMPEDKKILARIRPIAVNDPLLSFILFHNAVNSGHPPAPNVISPSVTVHPSAIIGVDGMRWIRKGKTLIRMKHMGNVILRDDVEAGALTVIHRGTIDATEIGSRTKIGSNVSIGHNVQIGCDVMITAGVVIGGSARIGRGCWIGIGSNIRDNVTVYQNIRIGMGAVVTRDLKEPGTYAGCPATRIGDWDGSL